MKEFCKCGHSKKTHIINEVGVRPQCCCVWQVSEEKEKIDNKGSLLRFCECEGYNQEQRKGEIKTDEKSSLLTPETSRAINGSSSSPDMFAKDKLNETEEANE